jgi:tellurite resistance protein TerC
MPRMETPLSFWFGFNLAIALLLLLDMTLLRQKQRAPSMNESILTTLVWIALAVGFGIWLAGREGWHKGSEFFAGYVIEYSLSMDNLFLFVLIFSNFKIAPAQQRRLLLWGAVGALIMRGAMIGAGVALLQAFAWIIYLFGAYILYAGFQMLLHRTDEEVEIEQYAVVRVARCFLPLSSAPHHGRFVVKEDGRRKFTLLFLVLVVVELTDFIFALDSIPAIFGVTRDSYIVYTSNICAILGLRSLYFVLAGAIKNLVYLHAGLACVLIFIGVKMLVEKFVPISTEFSLVIVGGILTIAIGASLFKSQSMRT